MPTTRQLRVAEIEVNASPTDERIVGIFRYESEQKGRRGPLVLLIAEINSTLYVYEQLLDVLNNAIERLRPLISGVDTDPMARFEKLVQGLNESVANFVSQEPSPLAWNRVNLFLLEIHDEHVCLTGVGHLCNLFIQRQADGTTRTFDLFGSLEQPAEVNPYKPFSGLIYGELKTGDVLFAGTQNFERLRQELGIVPRLKQLPPVTAALEIQQALEAQHVPDDFGAVIVAQVELDEPVARPVVPTESESAKELSTSSVERMYDEEKTADALLNPSMTPLPTLKGSGRAALQDYSGRFFAFAKTLPIRGKQLFTRARGTHDPITLTGLRSMNAGHGSFLTRKHKLIIIAGVSVVVLCVGGTLWYRHAQRASVEQAAWNAAYDQAMEQKNRAEASLVYGDDNSSVRAIQAADTIFKSLDTSNAQRLQAKKTLETALNEVRAKLRKEQRVEQPRSVFSLPVDAGAASLAQLAISSGKLYTYDPHGNQIIVLEPTTNVVKNIAWPDSLPPIASAAEKNTVVLFTADKKAYRVDPLKGTVTLTPYEAKQIAGIVAAVTYGTRVYVLDSNGNMIWRHTLGASIGAPSTYIKQTTVSLAQATSLAIDSNVYVGFSNGQIVRYLSGAQETWTPPTVDPALQSVSGLWASADSDRLVVSDPQGKRILVLRKDGKLVAQITSPVFKQPSAVNVDTATKTLFVVDGGSIYGFDLP